MVQSVTVMLIDDIDQSEAAETVHFGVDGTAYEIDLSARHANELSGGTAGIPHPSQQGSNDKGKTANPPATARHRRRARRRLRPGERCHRRHPRP
jgi:hypothetical protein